MLSPDLQDALQRAHLGIQSGAKKTMLTPLANELRTILENSSPEVSTLVDHVASLLEGLDASPGNDDITSALKISLQQLEAFLNEESEEEWAVDPEILEGFLDDRADSLDELEDLALSLEAGDEPESLAGIHRLVHSIKGDAGVLGLDDLSTLCHVLEDKFVGASHQVAGRLTLEAVERMRVRFKQLALGPDAAIEETPRGEACEMDVSASEPTTPQLQQEVTESVAPTLVDLPAPDALGEVDAELAGEFVTEAREHLESVDSSLLLLEQESTEEHGEAVNATFRAFHTIKGLAGFLNLNIMMRLAHEAEAMLHRVRSEEIQLSGFIVNAAFEVNDALKAQVIGGRVVAQFGRAGSSSPELSAAHRYVARSSLRSAHGQTRRQAATASSTICRYSRGIHHARIGRIQRAGTRCKQVSNQ